MSKRQIPVTKNQKVVMTINDIGIEGQGIGKIDGYTLFVDGALPGEKVEVLVVKTSKNFGFGKLVDILEPSKDRIEPLCPVAAKCGGCTLQHLSYEGQLAFKQQKVEELIKRIGKIEDVVVNPTIGMDEPWHYRNKVQFPVRGSNNEIQIGYYAKRSHRIVETDTCYIQDVRNEEIRQKVYDWMKAYRIKPYDEETHKGLVRHIVTRHAHTTKEMHVTLVINGNNAQHVEHLVESLKDCGYVSGIALNINKEKTNVILGKSMIHLYGDTDLCDSIGEVSFKISPQSFFQVNPEQTKKLYDKALEYAGLTGKETVLDLYCGIGSISLFLAQKAKKVIGVEVVPQAIEDAKKNAALNGMDNTEFHVGKAEEVVPRLYKEKGIKADVVVVDPPRKGCDEALLETIIQIAPKRIVYVSCDPATLARDLHYLNEQGYGVEKVQPVDMFPHSTHVETIVLLQKHIR